MPSRGDHAMFEGGATFTRKVPFPAWHYQRVAQASAGLLSAQSAWRKLREGFERGRAGALGSRGASLADASAGMRARRSFMHVYWGGAAIALLADVELRRLSGNRQSLDSALAGLQACCLPSDRHWSAKRFSISSIE